jgi:hypothetical protein
MSHSSDFKGHSVHSSGDLNVHIIPDSLFVVYLSIQYCLM